MAYSPSLSLFNLKKRETMEKNNKNNVSNLNIDIAPEVSAGVYSNLAIISHTPAEMVLDFAQMLPGNKNAAVRSRIIMNPIHAKRLLMALNDNIQKYESQFGPIEEPKVPMQGDTVPYDIIGKA